MKGPLLSMLIISYTTALADPVWHCSRQTSEVTQQSSLQNIQNQFSIASVNASSDVIGVAINDLIDVYSGVPVRISGVPLSACFMPNNAELTSTALTSLGLHPSTIQALARKSAIVQSHLYIVNTEKQMLGCITQHFPAVGYLDEPKSTNGVQPCF